MLVGEDWTSPRLVEMVVTSDGHLLGRCNGEAEFKAFLGEVDDLIRNIHGVAPVAELDGDEVGYLVAKWLRSRGEGRGILPCGICS